jgi:DNA-nicking Smr family endonuclease
MKRRAQTSSGAGERAVTADEARLWHAATRSLEPISAKPRVARGNKLLSSAVRPALQNAAPASVSPAAMAGRADPSRTGPASAHADPPSFARFDRHKARQIASGKAEVDARLDLHGLNQRQAYVRLRAFLRDAHARGLKRLLIITGKGGEPTDRLAELAGERQRGVLRRNVPFWLEEPELRSMIVRFTPAGVRHGGAGAIYVELRRAR